MGTITIQVAEAGQTTLTKTYTVPDAHIDRMVAAYQQTGNVFINGTATRAQVLLAWANQFIQNTISAVQTTEQQSAINALPTTTVITFT